MKDIPNKQSIKDAIKSLALPECYYELEEFYDHKRAKTNYSIRIYFDFGFWILTPLDEDTYNYIKEREHHE